MVLLRPKRHLVEIRLPTLTTYRILEPETVQITLPGETLRSGSEIEIWPSLVIRPSPASPHVLLSFSSADCTGSDVNQVCTGSSHVAESQLSALLETKLMIVATKHKWDEYVMQRVSWLNLTASLTRGLGLHSDSEKTRPRIHTTLCADLHQLMRRTPFSGVVRITSPSSQRGEQFNEENSLLY